MSRSKAGPGWLVAGACSRPPGRDSACRKLVGARRKSDCFLAGDGDDRSSSEGRLWRPCLETAVESSELQMT